jgi:hypothetical protein
MMKFTDAAPLMGTRRTKDGYLVADVRCARTGVQTYTGAELGMPDRAMVAVYRPRESVFDRSSKISFAHKPVTMGHPAEPVTSENWKALAVGDVGDEIVEDGAYIRVPLKLMDATAIARVESGEREISMGYTASIEMMDGVTPDGEAYNAVMKDIRINHLAIVPKGRAGAECRVGDEAGAGWGASPNLPLTQPTRGTTMTTKIVVDGVALTSLEDAATVVQSLQAKVKDAETKAIADAAAHKTALDAKDGEIAAKEAVIGDLKKKVEAFDASLDQRIVERQGLIADAARVSGKAVDPAGKTNADIRRAAVAARLGDEAVKDRDEAYVLAAFDALSKDTASSSGNDPLRNAIRSNVALGDDLTNSRNEYLRRLNDGWQGGKAA